MSRCHGDSVESYDRTRPWRDNGAGETHSQLFSEVILGQRGKRGMEVTLKGPGCRVAKWLARVRYILEFCLCCWCILSAGEYSRDFEFMVP